MKIDYQEVLTLARQVNDLASSVSNATNKSISAITGDLSSHFEGSAATVLASKMETLSAEIGALVSKINSVGTELNDYAAAIKKADELLSQLIEQNNA